MNTKITQCVQSHFQLARLTVRKKCVRSLNGLQPTSQKNISKQSIQNTALHFFLVDKPGSNAQRLGVHYGKLNKLTKKHSGSLPSFEQALERAAHCCSKSKLDKRSGFWQVELTKGAQDPSAFIAGNGQVLK